MLVLSARPQSRIWPSLTGKPSSMSTLRVLFSRRDLQSREFLRRGPLPEVSKATGKIVFTSSVHEIIPWAFQVNYSASKGGVALLMRSLAQELAPKKIRVNSVAPGAIRTPINTEAWQTEAARTELLKLIPYGRIGEPEDVARAIAWLASDASDYVTGTSLIVDGGMTLYPAFRGQG